MSADAKLQAWYAFLQAHATVTGALDRELRDRAGLALGDYEILLHLAGAEDETLRMREVAAAALLSPSGTTRAVDRLEREGSLIRTHDPADGRVTLVSLTAQGRRRLRAAAPVHLAGVRVRFLDALSPQDARALRTAMQQVLAANGRTELLLP